MALPFQSLSITSLPAANYAYDMVSGYAIRTLRNAVDEAINGPKKVKFYYRHDSRNFLQILVDSALQRVSTNLKNEVIKSVKDLIKKEKIQTFEHGALSARTVHLTNVGSKQVKEYGKMPVKDINGKVRNVVCRDCFNNPCSDGLMLKIPTKKPIKYSKYNGETTITNTYSETEFHYTDEFKANSLVWYDATALINFSSNKNLIITPVVGRDHSRKELASNGDINFSVSGHILSNMADVFPEENLAKFLQIMQYKGIIEIDNILLAQHNIAKIIIKDFSWSVEEGGKSNISYSFNGVGIQPVSEISVEEDTLYLDSIINQTKVIEDNSWAKWLKSKAEGTLYNAIDVVDDIASTGISNIHI